MAISLAEKAQSADVQHRAATNLEVIKILPLFAALDRCSPLRHRASFSSDMVGAVIATAQKD